MRFAPSLVLLTALASCAPPLPIADYIADARSPNAKITTQPLRFDVITSPQLRGGPSPRAAGRALPHLHARSAPVGRLSDSGAGALAALQRSARANQWILQPAGHKSCGPLYARSRKSICSQKRRAAAHIGQRWAAHCRHDFPARPQQRPLCLSGEAAHHIGALKAP